jgi:hypothetical protein
VCGSSIAWAGPVITPHLPEYLQADLQVRYRLESRDNFDFSDSVDDKDAFHLYRTRLSLGVTPHPEVKLFTQWQDARISHSQFANKSPYEDQMDLRQANLQLSDITSAQTGAPVFGLVAGRQEFKYGSQRVLGAFDWSNVANQTFDAGKVSMTYQPYNLKLDAFGGRLVPNKSPSEFNDFDASTRDRMAGYYASWQAAPKMTVEQYLIHRKTDKNISFGPVGAAALDEYTLGGRLAGEIPGGFDYDLESAWQGGKFGDKDINALMAVAIAGYTFDHPWKPHAALEFDYGSGDSDASDGTRRTFDNLYPTNHSFYGYMDYVSLQNLNNWTVHISAKPTAKLKLQSDWHFIYLDTYKDSLYSAGRAVTRTAAASHGSGVSNHVGNEIDLTLAYKFNDSLSAQTGYSHFFAGPYLAQTGANDDGDFAYIQTVLNF